MPISVFVAALRSSGQTIMVYTPVICLLLFYGRPI